MRHDSGPGAESNGCSKPDTLPSLRCATAPSFTFDNAGRLWAVWASRGHVYVQFSDNQGRSYNEAVAANRVPEPVAARGENRPKIGLDQNGRIYLTWTRKLGERFTGNVRFSYSDDRGRHFSEPITVNDNLELTSHRFDALSISSRGEVFVAWLDKRDRLFTERAGQKYTGAALYYARLNDDRRGFSVNRKVADHSCECCRIAVALDTDQKPVFLWRHIFGANIRDHALVKVSGPDSVGPVTRVSYDQWEIDGCPHHGPAIAIADSGIYHMVWFDDGSKGRGLFYGRSAGKGSDISSVKGFGNYQAQASHPHVMTLGEHVWIAWQEFDGQRSVLYAMQSEDRGLHWSDPRVLAESVDATDYPFVLSNGHEPFVAWHIPGKEFQLISTGSAELD